MPKSKAKFHEVKPGNILLNIARNNGLTVEQLLTIPENQKFKGNPELYPGSLIKLTHTVQVGQTVADIAKIYNIPAENITKYNTQFEPGSDILLAGISIYPYPDFFTV